MRPAMLIIGVILTGGTGVSLYLGNKLRQTRKRAMKASAEIRQHAQETRARNKLRTDWANEHEVISDVRFVAFPHNPQKIGGIEVSCPKCKEL